MKKLLSAFVICRIAAAIDPSATTSNRAKTGAGAKKNGEDTITAPGKKCL